MNKTIQLQIIAIRIEIEWMLIKRCRRSASDKGLSESKRLILERRLKRAAELKARYEDVCGITEALRLYRQVRGET